MKTYAEVVKSDGKTVPKSVPIVVTAPISDTNTKQNPIKQNKMSEQPSKRMKIVDFNHCISVYCEKPVQSQFQEYIISLIEPYISNSYIPDFKRNVIQINTGSMENFNKAIDILRNNENVKKASMAYIATPMIFQPGEHSIRYHTKNQDEAIEKCKYIIERSHKQELVVNQMKLAYCRDTNLFKLRVSVGTMQEMKNLLNNGFEVYRTIDQIIKDHALDVSCNFSSSYTLEDIKAVVSKICNRAKVQYNEEKLDIIKKQSNTKTNDYYYIINYKLRNEEELQQFIKPVVSYTPSKFPEVKKFISTADYFKGYKQKVLNPNPTGNNINVQDEQIIKTAIAAVETRTSTLERKVDENTKEISEIKTLAKTIEERLTNIEMLLWSKQEENQQSLNPNDMDDNEDYEEDVEEDEVVQGKRVW